MVDVDNVQSKIQLFLSCQKLPRMDFLSKSDPFIVCYIKERGDMTYREFFRTETIWNNEDPVFPDHIVITFHFESVQNVRFEVYDRDAKTDDLSRQDYIGSFETTVSKIMGSRGSKISSILVNERKKLSRPGQITIKGKEISINADLLRFTFSARKVERKNWFGLGKSDPFFDISQIQGDGSLLRVFASEPRKLTLNPKWSPVEVPLQRICNGDLDMPLLIQVYDWESNGSHKFIGKFESTMEEMLRTNEFLLINPKKQKKKASYKNSGVFVINDIHIQKQYSFLEYIQGGLELSLMVAIDFTASNGAPSTPDSLHYIRTWDQSQVQVLNEYQKAILSVGQILEDYDTDKQIPVYGFGGKYKGQVSHCFPVNFNDEDPEVDRIDGIMTAYANAIQKVSLSGPTYFAPILAETVRCAKEAVENNEHNYFVLLILTDGQIFDMEESIRLICEGASLPLSIIIAGVGDADFTNMDILDGDDDRLTHDGVPAERDIVQFVPMREFNDRGYTALAEATLEELPGQVSSYYGNRDIKPRLVQDESVRNLQLIGQSQRRLEIVPTAEVISE